MVRVACAFSNLMRFTADVLRRKIRGKKYVYCAEFYNLIGYVYVKEYSTEVIALIFGHNGDLSYLVIERNLRVQ